MASPSVIIKEEDRSTLVKSASRGISVIVLDAEIGPVDTLVEISSEADLVTIFGEPNDFNYEAWFAISTMLSYGEIVGVIRPSLVDSEYNLTNANIQRPPRDQNRTYDDDLIIRNLDEFNLLEPKEFLFASRTPGSEYNDIVVSVVDHGADQEIIFSNAVDNLNPGDIVKNSSGVVGIIYSVETSTRFKITLFDSTDRFQSGEVLYDQDGDIIDTISSISIERIYETLDCVPGLKWSSFSSQPGTSEHASRRNSKFDEFHIVITKEGKVLEKFLHVSKATDCRSVDGASLYWRDVINRSSRYVYAGDDSLVVYDETLPGVYRCVTRAGTTEIVFSNAVITRNGLVYWNNNTTPFSEVVYYQTNDNNIICGNIDSECRSNYFSLFRNLANPYAGQPVFNYRLLGGTNYDYTDPNLIHLQCVNAYEVFSDRNIFGEINFILPGKISADSISKLIQIVEQRKDCLTVSSPSRDSVINNDFSWMKVDKILSFFRTLPVSSYAIFDSGYKKIYDKFNDVYRTVPCAADVAGLCVRTSRTNEDWFSPAGYIRGILNNASELPFSPTRSEAFRLYKMGINPIVKFKGVGTVLFGDKTSKLSRSAFQFIGVRRLFIQIEREIEKLSKFFLFEINDSSTRDSYTSAIDGYLRGIQGKRGLYDFKIVCDESNNDFEVIDRNGLNVDIFINPSKTINCIEIRFNVTNTGVSFNEYDSAVGSECDNPYSLMAPIELDIEQPEPPPPDPEGPFDSCGTFLCWYHSQGDYTAVSEFISGISDYPQVSAPPDDVPYGEYYTIPQRVVLFSGDGSEYDYVDFKDVDQGEYDEKFSFSGDISNDIWGIGLTTGSSWSSWQYHEPNELIFELAESDNYQYLSSVPYASKVRYREIDHVEFRTYPQFDGASWGTGDNYAKVLALPINKNSCIIVAYQNVEDIRNQVKYRIEKISVPMKLVEVVRVQSISDDADVLRINEGRYYISSTETLNPVPIDKLENYTTQVTNKVFLVTKNEVEDITHLASDLFWNKLDQYFGLPVELEEVNLHDQFFDIFSVSNIYGGYSIRQRFASTNIDEIPPKRIYHTPQQDDPVKHSYFINVRGNKPITPFIIRQYKQSNDWPWYYFTPSDSFKILYNWPQVANYGAVFKYVDDSNPNIIEGIGYTYDYPFYEGYQPYQIGSTISIYDNILGNFSYTEQDVADNQNIIDFNNLVGLPDNFYLFSADFNVPSDDNLTIVWPYQNSYTQFQLPRFKNVPENYSDETNSDFYTIDYWNRTENWGPILDDIPYNTFELAPIGVRKFIYVEDADDDGLEYRYNQMTISTTYNVNSPEFVSPVPIYTESFCSTEFALNMLRILGLSLPESLIQQKISSEYTYSPILKFSGTGQLGELINLENEGSDTDAVVDIFMLEGDFSRVNVSGTSVISTNNGNGIIRSKLSRQWIGRGDYTIKIKFRFTKSDLMANNARYDNWIFAFPATFNGLYFWDYDDESTVSVRWWNTYDIGYVGPIIEFQIGEFVDYMVVRKNGIIHQYINNQLVGSFNDSVSYTPIETIEENQFYFDRYKNWAPNPQDIIGNNEFHIGGSYDGFFANFEFYDLELYNTSIVDEQSIPDSKGFVYPNTIKYYQSSVAPAFYYANERLLRDSSIRGRVCMTQDLPDSYISLELDDIYEINSVDVGTLLQVYDNINTAQYTTIQSSIDNLNWIDIAEVIQYQEGIQNIKLYVQARYLRLVKTFGDNYIGASEFNPFLTFEGKPEILYTQSSYYNDMSEIRMPTLFLLTTGSISNYASATNSSNNSEWIMMDLKSVKNIDSISVGGVDYIYSSSWASEEYTYLYTYGHDIEISDDGETWTLVGNTGTQEFWESSPLINTFVINSSARYIRIVNHEGYYIAVGEFKVNLAD